MGPMGGKEGVLPPLVALGGDGLGWGAGGGRLLVVELQVHAIVDLICGSGVKEEEELEADLHPKTALILKLPSS